MAPNHNTSRIWTFYCFLCVLLTVNEDLVGNYSINIYWVPPDAKHHVTLLGTQTGRPFPGRQESGGTGQAGNTRPMTETLSANPVLNAFLLVCVKSISLLVIIYHLSHHSKKKMLLSFYTLKNILPASFHNHCLFSLVNVLSPPQQEWLHLSRLVIFYTTLQLTDALLLLRHFSRVWLCVTP